MVENQERMSLCMMTESIEFLVVVQRCNVAHAKRTLHIKYPHKASGTMVFQYT